MSVREVSIGNGAAAVLQCADDDVEVRLHYQHVAHVAASSSLSVPGS